MTSHGILNSDARTCTHVCTSQTQGHTNGGREGVRNWERRERKMCRFSIGAKGSGSVNYVGSLGLEIQVPGQRRRVTGSGLKVVGHVSYRMASCNFCVKWVTDLMGPPLFPLIDSAHYLNQLSKCNEVIVTQCSSPSRF